MGSQFRSSAAGVAAAVLICWPVVGAGQQVVRIGSTDRPLTADAAPAYTVSQGIRAPAAVAFDRSDNLYVLDRDQRTIHVYGPNGRAVRQINGSRELRLPMAMKVDPTGAVWVSDIGRQAVVIFGTDGSVQREILFSEGPLGMRGLYPHPTGGAVASLSLRRESQSVPSGSTALVRLSADGRIASPHLLTYRNPAPATPMEEGTPVRGAGIQLAMGRPPQFAPALHWGVLPSGGVAAAGGVNYRIEVTDPNGAVIRILERPIEPRRVTAADRAWAGQERRRSLEGGGDRMILPGSDEAPRPVPPEVVEAQLRTLSFADVMPVVQGMTVDASGRLWVQRSGTTAAAPGPIDVIGADGRYHGTLPGQALPRAFSPGGLTASIEPDADGGSTVVVRRLPRALR